MALQPENGGHVTVEELVRIITILVHQMGGSAVIDSFEFEKARTDNKTVQLLTHNDPWRMTLKVVDN